MKRSKPNARRAGPSALLALAACSFTPAAGAASEPPSPLPLGWCLERAADANPEVAAEEAAAEAARQRVVPAGSLDDPRFRYEASNVPTGDLDFASTPLSGHQLGLSQKLPFPGLLGAREEAAEAAAEAAEASALDRRLRVAARVEHAWTELGFAQRALDITERNLDLLRQLARIAEAKYEVGEGRQPDVLRAQVQLTRLLDERLAREESVERAEAALASLLDLAPSVGLGRTEALADSAPIPALASLLERAETESPRLAALAAGIEQAERLQHAARLEGYPDFDLGLGYRIRRSVQGDAVAGDDFLGAGVTVRLPVNRAKWRARAAEQDALALRARAAWRGERARVRDAVRSAHASLERADAEVVLLETGLVPQSRQSLESSRAGYEVDSVDFLALVDSQVGLLRAELRLVRARAERRNAFAALEAAVGGALR